MVKKGKDIFDILEEAATEQQCRHHWIIEMAEGRTSHGLCKFCGERKDFKNYLPDCLAVDKEEYEEWLRKQRDDKGGGKVREDVFSLLGRHDRDTVKAGT